MFILFISSILFLFPLIIKNYFKLTNKTACLEAGFFSTGKIQLSFSLQFIFLLLLFILFDTEILFTFGFILNLNELIQINLFILIFLFITLIFEWKWNKLIWIN